MKQTLIQKISHNYAALLKRHHLISDEDVEVQAYGMEFFLSLSLVYGVILLSSLLLGLQCFVGTILFLLIYRFLRNIFGGWHASKPSFCLVVSWLVWFLSVVLSCISKHYFSFLSIIIGSVGALLLSVAAVKSKKSPSAIIKLAALFLVGTVLHFYSASSANVIFCAIFFVGIFWCISARD